MAHSSLTILKAACFAAASLGAVAFVAAVAMPDAVYAKNGNGGGKGGDKSAGKGGGKGAGQSSAKAKGGAKTASKSKSAKLAKPVKAAPSAVAPEIGTPLHPSEMGKWNAVKANQAALDAHIRNQNFNGTIGALSQYQLAAKAAAGEVLTPDQQAALDSLLGEREVVDVSDQQLADLLNADAVDGAPEYSVQDGVVSCSANCDSADVEAAQAVADAAADAIEDAAAQAALDDLLSESEARIIDESNKALSPERTEDLLDQLASALDVTRVSADGEAAAEDMPAEDVPAEDDILVE